MSDTDPIPDTKPRKQPQILPDKVTKVSTADMREALTVAWRAAFGEEPKPDSILVLLAHWALETGSGASMHNFNVGNIKGRPDGSDGHSWCFFRCNEIINGKTVWFDPPNPGCCFRAYDTLVEGVSDYLGLVHRRFSTAWPAVIAGNPVAYSKALKAQHYYTADETKYTAALLSIFNRFHISESERQVLLNLSKLGYSGSYDVAVKEFQRDQNLIVDGIVGPKTRAAIAAALQGYA